MNDIAILIPVLGRPANTAPLVTSIERATTVAHRLVFLCSPDDHRQIQAARTTGADVIVMDDGPGRGDYARKMNRGYRETAEPLVFLAADDVRFRAGWDEALLAACEYDVGVIGTDDLGNAKVRAGQHSTHSLVRRCYVEAMGATGDREPGLMLHEGYWHNWVDNELVEVAQACGCYMHEHAAVVEHLHPFWRKGEDDGTYERGRSHYPDDRRLYVQRRRLWA